MHPDQKPEKHIIRNFLTELREQALTLSNDEKD
jgi:hypothetical protein